MSYFKAILVIVLSLYTTSSLIGMDSFKKGWRSEFKYSNPYFEPKLQKTLMLIMLKNRDQDNFVLPKDVLNAIAKNNYDLYSTELLDSKIKEQSFEQFWTDKFNLLINNPGINTPERIKKCNSQTIKIDDFDFITMNDQGRQIFEKTILNSIADTFKPACQTIKQKELEYYYIMEQDEYNKAIQLPITLRTKMGNRSTVNVGKMKYSYGDCCMFAAEGIGGAMIVPTALQALKNLPLLKDLSSLSKVGIVLVGSSLGGYYGIWAYDQNKKYQGKTLYPRVLTILNIISPNGNTSASIPKWEEPEYTLENKPLVPEHLKLQFPNQTSLKKTLIKNKQANIIDLKNRE